MLGANGLTRLPRAPPMRGARSANSLRLALVAGGGLGVGSVVASRRHVSISLILFRVGVSVAVVLAVNPVVEWEPLVLRLSPHST